MASRTKLLEVTYHHDDETGMYEIGELDFGVYATLEPYIEQYGYAGTKEIIATLGHLIWEVKETYYKLSEARRRGQSGTVNSAT
jgi:hypothetical protein